MEAIKTTVAFLKGKKTYVTGIIAVCLGVYYNNIELVMIGLTAMGLRAGLTKQ